MQIAQWARYGWGVLAVAAALLLLFSLWPVMSVHPFLLLLGAVALAGVYGGFGAALLATVLSVLAIELFILTPGLLVWNPTDGVAELAFVLVGLGIGAAASARRHADEARRRSEEDLRLITDSVPALISYIDADLRYRSVNRTYTEWFGFAAGDVQGRFVWDVLGAEAYESLKPHFEAALRGERTEYERYVPYRTGGRYIHGIYIPDRDPAGRVRGIFVLVQDHTRRHEAEEAMRRWEAVVEASADGIAGETLDGVVTSWNRGAERLYGYTPEEMVGRSIKAVVPLERRAELWEVYARLARGETVAPLETERMARDGRRRAVLLNFAAMKEPSGRVVGVSVVTHDITERKRMEDRLRQAQERIRVGLQNARIHVIELDRDLRYTWIYSPTGEFARERIVGKTSEDLLRPDDARRLTALMRRVLETGHGAREFVELRIGGQTQVYDLAVEPLRDGAGAVIGVTGAAADVTEFKRVEAELRAFAATLEDRVARRTEDLVRSQEALRQNERLAAIGQMMTGLSHESRNALQRSLACLELLEKTVRDNPRAHMLLSEAQRAQQDLKQVYEEVQAYAAPIRLEVADQDLAQCWREAWKDLAPVREGRHAELVEDLDGVQTLCPVDAFRMRQVFRNLFENALAAAEGSVVIRIRGCEGEINGIPCLRVEVQDNGPGIPPERAERIFEPFYTTKTKGTGLGLSIVRRIVEGHGGTIHARKASEGGLELEIALPRQSKPAASVLSQSPSG